MFDFFKNLKPLPDGQGFSQLWELPFVGDNDEVFDVHLPIMMDNKGNFIDPMAPEQNTK